MVEIANIREHSFLDPADMQEATEKAVILARAAVAKVNLNAPFSREKARVTKRALIIGGGIAGIQTALDIADAGRGKADVCGKNTKYRRKNVRA